MTIANAPLPQKSGKAEKILLAILLTTFLIASVLYSVIVPIFESQDESGHFQFIRHMATNMSLPDFRDIRDLQSAGYQSHQAPLYYFFQGALMRVSGQTHIEFDFADNPFKSAGIPALYFHNNAGEEFPYQGKYRVLHFLRLTNVVAGALALLIMYRAARIILPPDGCLPVTAVAFVGLIPQFTYICGTLGNDAFSILFASLTFLFILKLLLDPNAPARYAALMAVSLAMAVMSKQTALFLLPVCYIAVIWTGGSRQRIRNTLLVTAVLAALIGWYYTRNYLLFHDVFITRIQAEELFPILVQRKTLPEFASYVSDYFIRLFVTSFWGAFGYMTIWLHWNTYLFYNIVAGAGLVSCLIGFLDADFRNRFSRAQRFGIALLALGLFLLMAEILLINFSYSQPQGRWVFPGLICVALLWGVGMERFVTAKDPGKTIFSYCLVILFACTNLGVLNRTVKAHFPVLPRTLGVVQTGHQAHVGELTAVKAVGQSFYCTIDHLDSVAVRFITFGRYNSCDVIFRLRDKSVPSRDLVTIRIPASRLRNDTFHLFKFPPLQDSRGREYFFLIESPDGRRDHAVSCYYTLTNSYDGGTAFVNDRPLPGDLAFITGSS